MKHYFSIVKVSTNVDLGDALSVGLLVSGEDRLWFDYSPKLVKDAVRHLKQGDEEVEHILRQIKRKTATMVGKSETALFAESPSRFDENFLKHLSISYNNLLRFSAPRPILLEEMNDDSCRKLFIDLLQIEEKESRAPTQDYRVLIENKLILPVREFVHTDVRIDSSVIPGLYFNEELECLGKNGILIAAKYIDFHQSDATVDKHISHYIVIMDSLAHQHHHDKQHKAFVLAEEPSLNSDQHKIWDYLHREERFDVKNPTEAAEVSEFFLASGARKFLAI